MGHVGRHHASALEEREFFIDNLLVRIHFIIVMIRWAGLAPWQHTEVGRVGWHHASALEEVCVCVCVCVFVCVCVCVCV